MLTNILSNAPARALFPNFGNGLLELVYCKRVSIPKDSSLLRWHVTYFVELLSYLYFLDLFPLVEEIGSTNTLSELLECHMYFIE